MSNFDVEGLDQFKNALQLLTETIPYEKMNEVYKIGLMAEREIKKFVPVDTGRLRASITTKLLSGDAVQVGTNVEYATYVNYGYTSKRRFLPAKYLDTPKGRKYLGKNNKSGIMLKAKTIKGKHFMEKGMQVATPNIHAELDNWVQTMLAKVGV